ncbi:DNA polymerase I, partial [Escherichia coli]|uniref:5'-3' exonuclease n=1 Tax=Escherichia coli TaxID=562 RepID=UPI003B430AB2|nr:DNA polymerase I [Escherichia coli]
LDHRGKNFRHSIYPDYKANRPPYEVALEDQLPLLPVVASAFGIPCIVTQGFEADDLIATLAAMCEDAGLGVVIASSDKDLCQLVTDNVIMYDAMHDKDPERFDVSGALIDVDKVKEKWGVWPEQMIDLQALTGDTVDNVPGVPKIG